MAKQCHCWHGWNANISKIALSMHWFGSITYLREV